MSVSGPAVLIAGGSGLIGKAAAEYFRAKGFEVASLSRGKVADLVWDPEKILGGDKNRSLIDAMRRSRLLLNFAGENVADGRLDDSHVARLIQSRVKATQALGKVWADAERPPLLWIQSSAVGYYGDRGEALVNEGTPRSNFRLSEICAANEAGAATVENDLKEAGGRMVVMRLGTVLDSQAPSWKKMSLASRFFVGGRMGEGTAWWSWIHLTDILKALDHFQEHREAEGIYNLVAPEPCRQKDMARAISRRFGRPFQFPAPAWALRLAFGRLAEEIFLASCRAVPEKLIREGFEFTYPSFEKALPSLHPTSQI